MNNKISKSQKFISGLHILGEIYTEDIHNLKSLSKIKKNISKIIKKHRLRETGSYYHQFSEGGFTGIISLVESHIAIHTWPELGCLTLDVYLCNYLKDNSNTCKKIFNEITKIFKPFKITKKTIKR